MPWTQPSLHWARLVNALLGVWLFISAFTGWHSGSARTNTWLVGACMALSALWAISTPPFRWVNMAFALWLAYSTVSMLRVGTPAFWSNLVVGLGVFVLSSVRSPNDARTP